MKTGILRDDVTVKELSELNIEIARPLSEWVNEFCGVAADRKRAIIENNVWPDSWYTDIKEDHKPCPRCGGTDIWISADDGWYYVICNDCTIRTDGYHTKEAAWTNWDKDYD